MTVPAGAVVLLDVSPPPLAGLDVAGTLAFLDGDDLALRCDWIRVRGRLIVGTAASPFQHRATITLTADFAVDCASGSIDRTLAIEGAGRLDLHGRPRSNSWLRLDQTALAGATSIVLESPVDWTSGEVIVIASTDFSTEDAETVTITSVAGPVVHLAAPLSFTHWGEREGVAYDGVGIDERAEVGLLTRNIVVQGVPEVLPSGKTVAGQTRVHLPAGAGPRWRTSWTEFRYLGEEEVLGRYPIHFHQLGTAPGSYVRHSSIHDCFNRWISIHETQDVEIENNVAYATIGHGYYFEDPSARRCTLRRNLGIATFAVSSGTGLHDDHRPAVFWLDHPENVVEDNVAGGSDAFGFWLDTKDGETGTWTSFRGNVSHSNPRSGFFQNARPTPSAEQRFSDCASYKNREFGYWIRSHERTRLVNCDAADNQRGYYFASSGFQTDPAGRDGVARVVLEGSLVIGETTNNASAVFNANSTCLGNDPWDALTGVEMYDGLVGVVDCTFASFADRPLSNGFVRKAGAFAPVWYASPWAIDPRNYAQGCTFVNDVTTTTREVWLRQPTGTFTHCSGTLRADNGIANTILVDGDGSVSGTAGARILPNVPFLFAGSGGAYLANWNAHVVTDPAVRFGQLDFNAIVPASVASQLALLGVTLPIVTARTVTVDSQQRSVTTTVAGPRDPLSNGPPIFQPRYPTNARVSDAYVYTYDPTVTSSSWARYFEFTFQFAAPGDWVAASIPLLAPTPGGLLQVVANGIDLSSAPAADLGALLASSGQAWWYDAAAERFWMRLELESLGGGTSAYDSASTTFAVLSY